jgi:aminopeptidase YwaD
MTKMTRKSTLLILLMLIFKLADAQFTASADNLQKHVFALAADSMKGRGVNSPESFKAADYIIKQFESIGIKPYNGKFSHPFSFKAGVIRTYGNNIIGLIEGTDSILKNEYLVIGAHYDHVGFDVEDSTEIVFNGADDNASGVAGLIETARLLTTTKGKLKRSVLIIAFDAEETGLNGSSYIVNQKVIPVDNVKAMWSLDMIGMLKDNQALELKGSATMLDGNSFFEKIALKYGIVLKELGSTVENRTDTYPFGELGIPAFAPTTGTISPYHKPEDDADLLDYDGMATITSFLTECAVELSGQPEIIAVPALARKAENFGKPQVFSCGLRLGIGSNIQNYQDDFFQSKKQFSGHLGVYALLHLASRFYLQTSVSAEYLTAKTAGGNLRLYSIYTPLHLNFDLISPAKAAFGQHHIFLFAGGYHTYHFSGRYQGKEPNFTNQFEEKDYGVSYGILFQVRKVQFGFTANRGLANVFSQKDAGDVKNISSIFTLGYRF